MYKSFSHCIFTVQNTFISVLYFHSIAEIIKKEAALVLMFLIFWKNYKKEQKNHVEEKRMKSAVALPHIQRTALKSRLNDKIMPVPHHLLGVLKAMNVKTGRKKILEMPVFYWSFRRDESSDTWANDLGPNFTELLIQIFGSFNKFLFLILILIYLILSWESQRLNEDRKAFNPLLLIYEYSGGGMDPGA